MVSGLLSDIWPDFSFEFWNSLNPGYNGYFYFDHICNIMIIKYLTTNDESVPITFMARVSLTIGREQKSPYSQLKFISDSNFFHK